MSEKVHVVSGSKRHERPYRAEDAAVHDSFGPAGLQVSSEQQAQTAAAGLHPHLQGSALHRRDDFTTMKRGQAIHLVGATVQVRVVVSDGALNLRLCTCKEC
jgi:hypothetical protein